MMTATGNRTAKGGGGQQDIHALHHLPRSGPSRATGAGLTRKPQPEISGARTPKASASAAAP